jgi:site-specific DNA-methyltransferase (cytosine-N4-specific)
LEETPELYVEKLVEVFREVRRVLRDDGTLWLNLGDSYATNVHTGSYGINAEYQSLNSISRTRVPAGCKPKDLIGIPWMVAFALRRDGWYLRSEIIWAKKNCMPESVKDRPTKAHEQIFLLAKSAQYFYDAEAIKEPAQGSSTARLQRGVSDSHKHVAGAPGQTPHSIHQPRENTRPQTRRAFELAIQHGLTDEHFDAIRAVGLCDAGKAQATQAGFGKNDPRVQALADEAKRVLGGYYREFLLSDTRNKRDVWTVATRPYGEAHFATFPEELIKPCVLAGSREGDLILDPFSGAGTTGVVSIKHARSYLGFELNPEYVAMSRHRIAEAEAHYKRSKGISCDLPRRLRADKPMPLYDSLVS